MWHFCPLPASFFFFSSAFSAAILARSSDCCSSSSCFLACNQNFKPKNLPKIAHFELLLCCNSTLTFQALARMLWSTEPHSQPQIWNSWVLRGEKEEKNTLRDSGRLTPRFFCACFSSTTWESWMGNVQFWSEDSEVTLRCRASCESVGPLVVLTASLTCNMCDRMRPVTKVKSSPWFHILPVPTLSIARIRRFHKWLEWSWLMMET